MQLGVQHYYDKAIHIFCLASFQKREWRDEGQAPQ